MPLPRKGVKRSEGTAGEKQGGMILIWALMKNALESRKTVKPGERAGGIGNKLSGFTVRDDF